MEALYSYTTDLLCLLITLLVMIFLHRLVFCKSRPASGGTLPPGRTGWPVIGETPEFLSTAKMGHPDKFVSDRMTKYSTTHVFKTHLLGKKAAVFCGAAGNRFLFSNENKLVRTWRSTSLEKVMPASTNTSFNQVFNHMRSTLPDFINPKALQAYVPKMDHIARRHFADEWDNKHEVLVYPLTKKYTFHLALRLFLSIEDPLLVDRLAHPFYLIDCARVSIPIDLPGTPLRKGIKASKYVAKEMLSIIKQGRIDLAEGRASPTQDILSHMLHTRDDNGTLMHEMDIAGYMVALILVGFDTVNSLCTFVASYLAELPQIYHGVYKEQMEIAKSKAPGETVNMEDLKKMKYSWNVACEVMRLVPPVHGAFREAIVDFTYNGFSIPKGWKLLWSASWTHKSPEYFSEPHKFDPSRFEGSGPAPYTFVPFGGGPWMCPGKEYARLAILVFVHHLVKRFKWDKIIPDEKIVIAPVPVPAKGLPVRLYPHTKA